MSGWKPGVLPVASPAPFSPSPEAHHLPPKHQEVIDTQRSAGLGRVLGMFSVPPFSWGA